MIAAIMIVTQAKLRNRRPRVPFFYPGAVPKVVRTLLFDDRRRRTGVKLVDGDGELRNTGSVAPMNDQIINIYGSSRTDLQPNTEKTAGHQKRAKGVSQEWR